jgi:hypothetical protein
MMTACVAMFVVGTLMPACQDEKRVEQLIQTLSDNKKDERDKAVADLVKIGPPALEALRAAAASTDAEVKTLAASAIEQIEWVGLEKLKVYVKEGFDDECKVEPSKLKGLSRWFPDTRFYEVAGAAPAGGAAAMMGMQPPRSLFAVKKLEHAFSRLLVKGVFCTSSIDALLLGQKVVLAKEEDALDFAIAVMDLYSAGAGGNAAAFVMGGGTSRLDRTEEGWSLVPSAFGANMIFKIDKDGLLLGVTQKTTNPYAQLGLGGGGADSEERTKLEIAKLKLEIEVLKRQMEKK